MNLLKAVLFGCLLLLSAPVNGVDAQDKANEQNAQPAQDNIAQKPPLIENLAPNPSLVVVLGTPKQKE